jgi:serine protease Do
VQIIADFGGNQVKPESGGSGTGFAVDRSRGLIVTAAHVVEGAAGIKVVLPDHEQVPAVVVGRSDCDDLAILKVNITHGLAQVKMGNSSGVALGQDVVALGYPLPGLSSGLALTAGTISQLDTHLLNYQDLLGVDAAINLGSSGGPIVDRQGHVIGITVLGVTGAENTHFAVATKYANPILSQLARGANVHYIGLNLVPNSSHFQSFYGTSHGMIVVAVTSGSPADQIGVQPGDLLLRVEGSQVSNAGHLCDILDSRADGAVIKVQVYRQSIHEVLEGELVIGKLGVAGPASQNLQPIATVRPVATPTP